MDWNPPPDAGVTLGYFPCSGGIGAFKIFNVDALHLPLVEFLDELEMESTRGKVIITAAVIESLLRELLLSYFSTCGSDASSIKKAVPQSAARQAELCVAIGLLSKQEFRTIELIQEIRNQFAHVAKKKFEDRGISDVLAKLDFVRVHGGMPFEPKIDFFLANGLTLILEMFDRPRQLVEGLRNRNLIEIVKTLRAFDPNGIPI